MHGNMENYLTLRDKWLDQGLNNKKIYIFFFYKFCEFKVLAAHYSIILTFKHFFKTQLFPKLMYFK